jgi:hypothetical protein
MLARTNSGQLSRHTLSENMEVLFLDILNVPF